MLEMLALLAGSVTIFAVMDPAGFRIAAVVALILAIVLWVGCANYTVLWNKRFRMGFFHHTLCACAALVTLAASILFPAASQITRAADASLLTWQTAITSDNAWAESALRSAYDAVRRLGIEDFTESPQGHELRIPTSRDESREAAARAYAASAWSHFVRSRPFLAGLVSIRTGIPTSAIFSDVKRWQETNPTYPPQRAVELAVEQIRTSLQQEAQELVTKLRMAIIATFVIAQSLAYGVVGWAAYRDIKVRT